jgi:hypothetical protein
LEGVVDPIEQVSIGLFDALVPDSDSFQDYEQQFLPVRGGGGESIVDLRSLQISQSLEVLPGRFEVGGIG